MHEQVVNVHEQVVNVHEQVVNVHELSTMCMNYQQCVHELSTMCHIQMVIGLGIVLY